MTNGEFLKIEKELLPHFPGFAINGSNLVPLPVTHFHSGIFFERSGDKTAFYLRWFVTPLTDPRSYVAFTQGSRLRHSGGEGWYKDQPDLIRSLIETINRDGLPHLHRLNSLDGYLSYASRKGDNGWTAFYRASLLSLKCEYELALTEIDEYYQTMGGPWKGLEVTERLIEELRNAILEGHEPTQSLLQQWMDFTAHNLKLDKFRLTTTP
jgi:hypothetical protein